MRQLEINAWALQILERVGNNQPIEDARVELKTAWPDAKKAARQIAAHANAARGEPILWLIGVDEKNGIKGANHQELSNWFAQIKAEFESDFPGLQDVNVHYKNLTVAALCFETALASSIRGDCTHQMVRQSRDGQMVLPLLGERVGVRANRNTRKAHSASLSWGCGRSLGAK